MKITAPDKWLDDVDVEALRLWFLNRGFVETGKWLDGRIGDEGSQILLPSNLKEFRDWKLRLLEAIEQAATMEGITAAEWFERQRKRLSEPSDAMDLQDAEADALGREWV